MHINSPQQCTPCLRIICSSLGKRAPFLQLYLFVKPGDLSQWLQNTLGSQRETYFLQRNFSTKKDKESYTEKARENWLPMLAQKNQVLEMTESLEH
jgi:hypothetical protein